MISKISNIFFFWKYYFHNRKLFEKNSNQDKKKVLIEFNSLCDSHIVYSYLAKYFHKNECQIQTFNPKFYDNNFRKYIFLIKKLLLISYIHIYNSFGSKTHIIPEKKKLDKNNIEKKIKKIFNKIKNKKDVLKIKLENVVIGDLIYDGFLRKYNRPTININTKHFKNYLIDTIYLFYFWENYFKKNSIEAVISSHTVYEFGILIRLAIKYKIFAITAGSFFIFNHNKKNFSIFDMRYYRTEFKKIPDIEKKKKIEISKKLLEKKFSGLETIENKVSALPKDSPFKSSKNDNRILRKSKKKKILIAAHHFSDAPNVYGKNLFTDFYEWIDFLGKKSENSNFEWYIKFHPLEFEDNKKTCEYFLQKYKKLILIDKNVKHGQIIRDGIDLVLTVYGTIGFEYAYFKIPVINAGPKNPHIAYDFNHYSSSKKEYNNAIDNFDKIKINYNKKQLYEYFYMRYLHGFYLFDDEIKTNSNKVNYQSPEVYKKWMNNFSKDKHRHLLNQIKIFLKKKTFRFNKIW